MNDNGTNDNVPAQFRTRDEILRAHAAQSAAAAPKRFYKLVEIAPHEGGFTVTLDGKTVKTPARHIVYMPNLKIAQACAAEWNAQTNHIHLHAMPVNKLCYTVQDAVAQQRADVIAEMLRFADTDLLCYFAAEPEGLVARQREAWSSILTWVHDELSIKFNTTNAVNHCAQPAETIQKFGNILEPLSDFNLAALYTCTTLLGSTVLGLALMHKHLTPTAAWAAAHVDEEWNREKWGEDAEDTRVRAQNFVMLDAIATAVWA